MTSIGDAISKQTSLRGSDNRLEKTAEDASSEDLVDIVRPGPVKPAIKLLDFFPWHGS